VREQYNSYWEALNIFDMNPFKANKIEKNKKDHDDDGTNRPYLEEELCDKWFRVFMLFCIIYYYVDIGIKMCEMKFPEEYLDICKFGFLLHHVVCVFAFKSVFIVHHYPWFIAGVPAYHTMLVAFPHFSLNNPLYLFFVFAWMYGCVQKPFRDLKFYKTLFVITCALMVPLVFLWWSSC
jgi:hypothetical protein